MEKKMNKSFRPAALVNVTNRCNLKCKHCFVFREGTPNKITEKNEMPAHMMIRELKKYRKKYGILRMLWMGGEPLLREDVLKLGMKLFFQNVITTNGTLPLINLGPKIKWVISLDGPEEINDEIRGKGCFNKVINNLNTLPDNFNGDLQSNCVVTKKNENYLEELIKTLQKETPIRGITFSFYVPKRNDMSEFGWKTLEERDLVIKNVMALKKKYPQYILNNMIVFEFMLSQNALQFTNNCPVKKYMLPLYLGEDGFEHPFCCYGNDVDCDLCGAWAVFHLGAIIKANPGWPEIVSGAFKRVTPTNIKV